MDDALANEVSMSGAARVSAARDWRNASFGSIATSSVFSAPDLNTVRALCLLLYRRPPENLDSSFWILCAAVSVAGQLDLVSSAPPALLHCRG